MSSTLRIILAILGILLLILTLILISKDKLPIKYSLPWIFSSLLIALVGIIPNIWGVITNLFGFYTTSNFVIGIILLLLLGITLLLTIIVSTQKDQIKLLTQEISMLKKNK